MSISISLMSPIALPFLSQSRDQVAFLKPMRPVERAVQLFEDCRFGALTEDQTRRVFDILDGKQDGAFKVLGALRIVHVLPPALSGCPARRGGYCTRLKADFRKF